MAPHRGTATSVTASAAVPSSAGVPPPLSPGTNGRKRWMGGMPPPGEPPARRPLIASPVDGGGPLGVAATAASSPRGGTLAVTAAAVDAAIAAAAAAVVAEAAPPLPPPLTLLGLPRDMLLRLAGELPPADLFAFAATCTATWSLLRRASWVRLFECLCLPVPTAPSAASLAAAAVAVRTRAGARRGTSSSSRTASSRVPTAATAPDAGALGGLRPLAGPERDPRRWYVWGHSFSAAGAEAEARRAVGLAAAVEAVTTGSLEGVNLRAELCLAALVGWAVGRGEAAALSLCLLRAPLRHVTMLPATSVVRVLPFKAARACWGITSSAFAPIRSAPGGVSTTGVAVAAHAAFGLPTMGGLMRAAVGVHGSLATPLAAVAATLRNRMAVEKRAGVNQEVLRRLAAEAGLDAYPGAADLAATHLPDVKRFVQGAVEAAPATSEAVAAALAAVAAAFRALSPTLLRRVTTQDGTDLWLNARYRYAWIRCISTCRGGDATGARAAALAFERYTVDHPDQHEYW
ncbi:hypothetical protein MMPV_005043 [Pyropia vietnamensis]